MLSCVGNGRYYSYRYSSWCEWASTSIETFQYLKNKEKLRIVNWVPRATKKWFFYGILAKTHLFNFFFVKSIIYEYAIIQYHGIYQEYYGTSIWPNDHDDYLHIINDLLVNSTFRF